MSPNDFLQLLWRERAVAIMRSSSQEVASEAMRAAVRGGFRVVEFTMTTPGVLELIAELSEHSGVVVGAGTVLTVDQARAAVAAGAGFLVSPIVDEDVIRVAGELGVAVAPGAHTPTEMVRAHRAGAQLQKLFPVAASGPAAVRSVLGPLPFLRVVPTNGVTAGNVGDYLRAGAYAVGFVRALFAAEDMSEGRYDRIGERAGALRSAIMEPQRAAAVPLGPSPF